MERKNSLTTGELARIMGISKHTLFHYDEIGLFCPEKVLENGYRCYSLYQLETLDTILMLRDLGMPIKEIRSFLDQKSPEKLLEVFSQREEQIEQQLERLRWIRERIVQKKQKIQTALELDFSRIEIRERPDRYYIYEKVPSGREEDILKKTNELITRYQNQENWSEYDIAYLQHEENVRNGRYDCYDNAALLLKRCMAGEVCGLLPEGFYLIAYHVGHWENIGEAYERMKAYRKAHGIETTGEYVEYYLVDNLTVNSQEEYVTAIEVRMEYQESHNRSGCCFP